MLNSESIRYNHAFIAKKIVIFALRLEGTRIMVCSESIGMFFVFIIELAHVA